MAYTVFKNGVGQFVGHAVGGAAGALTVVHGVGLKSTDTLLSVTAIAFDTDGDIASVTDLTSEFSITADATINNSGGTATTDALVVVEFARTTAYED